MGNSAHCYHVYLNIHHWFSTNKDKDFPKTYESHPNIRCRTPGRCSFNSNCPRRNGCALLSPSRWVSEKRQWSFSKFTSSYLSFLGGNYGKPLSWTQWNLVRRILSGGRLHIDVDSRLRVFGHLGEKNEKGRVGLEKIKSRTISRFTQLLSEYV